MFKVDLLALQEDWFLKKSLATWAAVWLIVNWVLGIAFIPKKPGIVLQDQIFYFAVSTCNF